MTEVGRKRTGDGQPEKTTKGCYGKRTKACGPRLRQLRAQLGQIQLTYANVIHYPAKNVPHPPPQHTHTHKNTQKT